MSAIQRRGRWYFYYRRGDVHVRLHGKLGSKKFEQAYLAARGGMLPPSPGPKAAENKKATVYRLPKGPKNAGVYLLFLEGEIVYVGASLDMSQRVKVHGDNGRPYDRAYFISTPPSERFTVEKALISALNPPQNRRRARQIDPSASSSVGVLAQSPKEGIMPQQYQGQNVRSTRDAKQGDPGFMQGQDQVVITLDDGSEKVIRRNELQGQPQQAQQR